MSFSIQNSTPQSRAIRDREIASNRVRTAMSRLASGYRINRAADDAAGLAIASKFRTDIANMRMSLRNVFEADTTIRYAEEVLHRIHDILLRMKELAVQHESDQNETLRPQIYQEWDTLKEEINRLTSSSRYQEEALFDGLYDKTWQVGGSNAVPYRFQFGIQNMTGDVLLGALGGSPFTTNPTKLLINTVPGATPMGFYSVFANVTVSTTRTTSTTDPNLSIITDAGGLTGGSYAVELTALANTVRSFTYSSADFSTVADNGMLPAGTHNIDMVYTTTTSKNTVSTNPNLTISNDPGTLADGTHTVELIASTVKSATDDSPDVTVSPVPATVADGVYAVNLATTRTVTDSSADISTVDNGVLAEGTHQVTLATGRFYTTSDPADLAVTADNGTLADGTYGVDLTTMTTRLYTDSHPALDLVTDNGVLPDGNYDVEFMTTRFVTDNSLDVTTVDNGLLPDGNHDVNLVTTRYNTFSDPTLSLNTDNGLLPDGTYNVTLNTVDVRTYTDTTTELDLVTDNGVLPDGNYDVELFTTRTATPSGAGVGVVTDNLLLADGIHDIELSTTQFVTLSNPAETSVVTDPGTVTDGTYTIHLDSASTRVYTDSTADLSLVTDNGVLPDGNYDVELFTGRFTSTSTPDLNGVVDNGTLPDGTYAVEFTTDRFETFSTTDLSLVTDNGTLADGTYNIDLITVTNRNYSDTTAELDLVTDNGILPDGSYDVALVTARAISYTDADLSGAVDNGVLPDGTYAIDFTTTQTATLSNPAETSIVTDPGTVADGTYTIHLDTSAVRNYSDTTTELALVTDNGVLPDGSYAVSLVTARAISYTDPDLHSAVDNGILPDGTYAIDFTTTQTATSSTADISVVTDPGTVPDGAYVVHLDTSAVRNYSDTTADLDLVTDNGILADGSYAVELFTGRFTSTSNANLSNVVDNGTLPDGTYAIDLTTDQTATVSDPVNLSVVTDPGTVADGTYAIDLTTVAVRNYSDTTTDLALVTDNGILPDGSYAVELFTGRTISDTGADLSGAVDNGTAPDGSYAVNLTTTTNHSTDAPALSVITAAAGAPDGVYAVNLTSATFRSNSTSTTDLTNVVDNGSAVGTFDVILTATRTRTSSTSNADLTVGTIPMTAPDGTYGVNVTQLADYATGSATDWGKNSDPTVYDGNGASHNIRVRDTFTGLEVLVSAADGQSLTSIAANIQSALTAAGINMTVTSGGTDISFTHNTLGSNGQFTVQRERSNGTVLSSISDTGLNIAGTIGGDAAAGSGANPNMLTVSSGALTGLEVTYTGSSTGSVGTVTLGSVYTINGGTIGGNAASWDSVNGRLTGTAGATNGVSVDYVGPALTSTSQNVGSITFNQWDEITGGTIGGNAATWDNVAQTLTGTAGATNGAVLGYTGPVPAPPGGVVGNYIVDTDITGGTIGGNSATWDNVAKTLTGTSGATSGIEITYSGADTAGYKGDIVIQTDIIDGTIGGQAATWDNVAKTLTGDAGSVAGFAVSWAGPVTSGVVDTFTINTTYDITGGTIGGNAATWDNVAKTLTGTAGTTNGLVIGYTGPEPVAPGGNVGSVTFDTQIVDGTIGGQAATWNNVSKTLTGDAGAVAGFSVDYTGPIVAGNVGDVTVETRIVDGTIGGQAATWDNVAKTLTGDAGAVAGFELSWAGPVTSGVVDTFTINTVTSITGGNIGGDAATWDNIAQTLTSTAGVTNGLVLSYTGAVPAAPGADVGTVTFDTQITDGTIGGQAATWDNVAKRLTGDAGTVAGFSVDYSGPIASGYAGDVVIATSIVDGTIGGQAATWDDVAKTLTGDAGSVAGFTLSWSGDPETSSGVVDTFTINTVTTITGGNIGGDAATWDNIAQTLTSTAGVTNGLVIGYSGAVPAAPGADVGTVTFDTQITDGTIGGQSATWNNVTKTLTGDSGTANGFSVNYTGPIASGYAGDVVIATSIVDGTIGGQAATWDDVAKTLTGDAGSVAGFAVSWAGDPETSSGVVDTFTINTVTTVTGATIGGDAAAWDDMAKTITGTAGAANGYAVSYTGPIPVGPGGTVGTLTIDTQIVDGTIGGWDATWNNVTKRLTGDAGFATAGFSVDYTGPVTTGYVGDVTVETRIVDGTIGGQAATWDDVAKTLTGDAGSVAGFRLGWAGPVTSGIVDTFNINTTTAITGGNIGGFAATWDSVAQTLTATAGPVSGLAIGYSGPVPASPGADVGTITFNTQITDGTIGGRAATWDNVAKTLTGDNGSDADGFVVSYTGAITSGVVGDVTIDTQITDGTIGGQAATWDNVAKTLTGDAGAVGGFAVSWAGPVVSGIVDTFNITTTTNVTGAQIGSDSAVWDGVAQTITGSAGVANGYSINYTGPIPSGPGGVVGTVTVDTQITDGTIGGQAATWDNVAKTLTGDGGTAAGFVVNYTGPVASGTVATINVDTQITDGTIGGQAATWDNVAKTLTGDAGSVAGFELSWTGPVTSGVVDTFNINTTTVATGGTIGGDAATWDSSTQTLTSTAGATAGVKVYYDGPLPAGPGGNVGTITLETRITDGTIGGRAATWDDVAKTLTGDVSSDANGFVVTYTGPVASGVVGTVDVQVDITGGDFSGNAAVWDPVARTLTGTAGPSNGLEITYTGGDVSGKVADVTVTSSVVVSGATIGGFAATWDNTTKEIMGTAGPATAYRLFYYGPVPPAGGPIGDLIVTTTTTSSVDSVTIGGYAALWNDATQTIEGQSGLAGGFDIKYTGPLFTGTLGQVNVTETTTYTIDGATIGGHAASWDPMTQEILGLASSPAAGTRLQWSGPIPPTGGYLADFVVTETSTRTITSASIGGFAATIAGDTLSIGAGPLAGVSLDYVGNTSGFVGNLVVPSGSATILDATNLGLDMLNGELARLGAAQNQLDYIRTQLVSSTINYQRAESEIRDADMAEEMIRLTTARMVENNAASILAQGTITQFGVLNLLEAATGVKPTIDKDEKKRNVDAEEDRQARREQEKLNAPPPQTGAGRSAFLF